MIDIDVIGDAADDVDGMNGAGPALGAEGFIAATGSFISFKTTLFCQDFFGAQAHQT